MSTPQYGDTYSNDSAQGIERLFATLVSRNSRGDVVDQLREVSDFEEFVSGNELESLDAGSLQARWESAIG